MKKIFALLPFIAQILHLLVSLLQLPVPFLNFLFQLFDLSFIKRLEEEIRDSLAGGLQRTRRDMREGRRGLTEKYCSASSWS